MEKFTTGSIKTNRLLSALKKVYIHWNVNMSVDANSWNG